MVPMKDQCDRPHFDNFVNRMFTVHLAQAEKLEIMNSIDPK